LGLTTITLHGNSQKKVRITDIKAIKECQKPFDGTYLVGYTQGAPEDTIKLGINLDAPEPIVQEMVWTAAHGFEPVGESYFLLKTIAIAPGESLTLTIGARTDRYACTFTLRMFVATSAGTVYQDIDNHGKPFGVTAKAAPSKADLPLSGYRAAYVQNPSLGWHEVDPGSYSNQ
jgi:hypothetical protein